jgi:hypothetical protein
MTQWGLDALFNPAKRHMDEEKRRLQSTREQIGDSSGGKRIDLEAGKVSIARKKAVAGSSDVDPDAEAPDGARTTPTASDAADAVPGESPARARARQRRARG